MQHRTISRTPAGSSHGRRGPGRLWQSLRAALALPALVLAAGVAAAACDGGASTGVRATPEGSGPLPLVNTGRAAKFMVYSRPTAWAAASGTFPSSWYNVGSIPEFNTTMYQTGDVNGLITFHVQDAQNRTIDDTPGNTRRAAWSTNNAGVVKVSRRIPPNTRGLFEASVEVVGGGTAVLSLTLDSSTDSAKVMSMRVTVNDQRVATITSITINPSAFTMQVGDTRRISVSTTDANGAVKPPTQQVTFSSTPNLQVTAVSVSEADVVALSGGTGTITANAHSQTATATVSVPGPLASLTLSSSRGTSLVDGCTQVTATRKDAAGLSTVQGGALSWSSSAPGVAAISSTSGDVATVCAGATRGTATITATAGSVSGTLGLQRWQITGITVTPNAVNLHGWSNVFVDATVTGDVGNGPQVLAPVAGGALDVVWASDNTGIATVTGGPRRAEIAGRYTTGTTTVRATLGGVQATVAVSANSPMFVGLSGPDMVSNIGTYTYTASVQGGVAPYTYHWEHTTSSNGVYTQLLSPYTYPFFGNTAQRQVVCNSPSYTVRVRVTGADGQVTYATRWTNVSLSHCY